MSHHALTLTTLIVDYFDYCW